MEKFNSSIFNIQPLNTNCLAIIRMAIGCTFLYHGSILWDREGITEFSKFWGTHFNIPFPLVSIYLTKIIQFFGGLFMVLGLFTRFSSFCIAITMAVATVVAHKGVILNIPAIHYYTSGEGETAFVYLLLFLSFVIVGPGTFSLDNYLFNKNSLK